MFELTEADEAALAYIWIHQDELPVQANGPKNTIRPFVQLRDADMIKAEFDGSYTFAMLEVLRPLGVAHYQRVHKARRRFASLHDTADELISQLAATDTFLRRTHKPVSFEIDEQRVEDYRELANAGLIKAFWADDQPWEISPTDKGLSYVRGDFLDEESEMEINFSPIINNSNNGTVIGGASATATTGAVTIDNAIQAIRDSSLDDEEKQHAEATMKELGGAAEAKDVTKFAKALESVSSIVKSTASLGMALLPVAGQLIGKLFS